LLASYYYFEEIESYKFAIFPYDNIIYPLTAIEAFIEGGIMPFSFSGQLEGNDSF
jgi:hypothetical protein